MNNLFDTRGRLATLTSLFTISIRLTLCANLCYKNRTLQTPNGKINQPEQNPKKCNVSTNMLNNIFGAKKKSKKTQSEGKQYAKINTHNS